jgi:hypothetical protein
MIMEERTEGILLRPVGPAVEKLTWEATAREMAVDQIRAVGKTRLGSRIDALSDDEASTLRRLITEMFGE